MGCGKCDHCVRGETHLCEQMTAFGINIDGGFAEYVRIPENAIIQGNIAPLAEDISYQLFGMERVFQTAKSASGRPQELIEAMASAIRQFVGEAEQSDDLTMLAIQKK